MYGSIAMVVFYGERGLFPNQLPRRVTSIVHAFSLVKPFHSFNCRWAVACRLMAERWRTIVTYEVADGIGNGHILFGRMSRLRENDGVTLQCTYKYSSFAVLRHSVVSSLKHPHLHPVADFVEFVYDTLGCLVSSVHNALNVLYHHH